MNFLCGTPKHSQENLEKKIFIKLGSASFLALGPLLGCVETKTNVLIITLSGNRPRTFSSESTACKGWLFILMTFADIVEFFKQVHKAIEIFVFRYEIRFQELRPEFLDHE